jgi:hypothetical protein
VADTACKIASFVERRNKQRSPPTRSCRAYGARQQLRHDWKVSEDQAGGGRTVSGLARFVVSSGFIDGHNKAIGPRIQPDPQGASRHLPQQQAKIVNPLT